jgi:hypothetical protein
MLNKLLYDLLIQIHLNDKQRTEGAEWGRKKKKAFFGFY